MLLILKQLNSDLDPLTKAYTLAPSANISIAFKYGVILFAGRSANFKICYVSGWGDIATIGSGNIDFKINEKNVILTNSTDSYINYSYILFGYKLIFTWLNCYYVFYEFIKTHFPSKI